MKENSIKNERSSIEEDIKILEEFKTNRYSILLMKYGDRIKTNFKLEKAIEHILSDYKRVLKENEHKTEKIENQKSELAILNDKQKDFNKLQNTLKSYKGQFRRQEKENEKLKNQEATAREINELLVQRYSNSISVQKVKDKIEELEKDEYSKYYYMFLEERDLKYTIQILQELIEEREEK